jgi:hypothetical protein
MHSYTALLLFLSLEKKFLSCAIFNVSLFSLSLNISNTHILSLSLF